MLKQGCLLICVPWNESALIPGPDLANGKKGECETHSRLLNKRKLDDFTKGNNFPYLKKKKAQGI
jgi:hypothetical protein